MSSGELAKLLTIVYSYSVVVNRLATVCAVPASIFADTGE
jgi:hypothetical protein